MKKTILFGTISVVLSVLGTLLVAELVLHFLPYHHGLRAQAVNESQPVFRFTPNRTATLSRDWNFNLVNHVHVNNDGFVNNIDYDASAKSPLLAVVGDSYIEAAIVPYAETVQGRLAEQVRGKGRVYSFAAAGAGLSQYLIWIRYARDKYRPNAFLINIISNDFKESLHWREHSPGFWRFTRQPDGSAAMRLTEYEPSLARRIFRRSALAMYLMLNVQAEGVLQIDIQNLGPKDRRWVANIEAKAPEKEMADFRWAIDQFLDRLPEAAGVGVDRIVLSFDGFRPEMYGTSEDLEFARSSVWAQLRSYFMQEAAKRGIATIDLDVLFREQYARDGRRFEHPTDGHWSGHGHEVLAQAMRDTKVFQDLFSVSSNIRGQ